MGRGQADDHYGQEVCLSVSRRWLWPTARRRDTLSTARSAGDNVPSFCPASCPAERSDTPSACREYRVARAAAAIR
eukprot:2908394-Pyramimonas_sp.AAC.1